MKIKTLFLSAMIIGQSAFGQQADVIRDGNLTAVPALVAATTLVSTNSSMIPLRKDAGVAILPKIVGTNAGTANVVFTFSVSPDGTLWSTTGPLTYTLAMNGTNPVVGYKNFTLTDVNNVRYMRLSSITNAHSANILITSITWSYFRN